MFKTIVVATDFSEPSVAAWRAALELARAHGAEVILVHVYVELPAYSELAVAQVQQVYVEQRRWVTHELDTWTRDAAAAGVRARFLVKDGVAADTIAEVAAKERADLVVVGTAGRSGLQRLVVGSVAERVVRIAPCPVLVTRPRATDTAA